MAPKSHENLHIPDTEKVEKKKSIRTRDKFIGAGAAAALALGLAACGDGENVNATPSPSETTISETPTVEPSDPTETSEPTDTPSSPEQGEGVEWGKFELPTPEREVLYDFGSREAFLDWFVIDADTYTTPEEIAEKHVMNLEGLINAGFSYQLDESIAVQPAPGEMLSHAHVAAAHEAYDNPIIDRIAVPGVDMDKLISYDYKLSEASMFLVSYYDRRDDIPYVVSQEYYSSVLLSMDADDFAEATEFTVEIYNGDSDNGLSNVAEWRRKSGQPAQVGTDYVDHVTFSLDESTGTWLVVDRVNISRDRSETP